ncbi:MAG: type II secretion system F family protein [Candidatus Aenigmarchaeota archaeon]|nr:type II secretion system F family protein [Candidatus Aenigmarchaeota archaeon]
MKPDYKIIGRMIPNLIVKVYNDLLKKTDLDMDGHEFTGFLLFFSLLLGVFVYFLQPLGYYSLIVGELAFFSPWILSYVLLDFSIYRRTREIEKVLSDFLQLTSANIRAGMSIDKALWFAIRPEFGALSREIEGVAKETMSGKALEESLKELGEKFDSLMIKRAMKLIVAGIRSGGEMAYLLDRIAHSIRKTQTIQKEIAANVMTYTIFIFFAVCVAAPFLFGLSFQVITIMQQLSETISIPATGAASFSTPINFAGPAVSPVDFKIFAIVSLVVTSLFSSMLLSIIRSGSAKETVRIFPILAGISVVVFFAAIHLLGGVMGSIIY